MNINFNTATTAEPDVVSAQHSGGSIFSTTIEWVLLLGALLIPLFFLPWTSDVLEFQKQTLLIILSAIGLVAWLVGIIKEGRISFINSKLALPIIILLLAVFLSSAFSMERFKSFLGAGAGVASSFATFVALGIYFFLMLSVVKDQGAKIIRYFTFSATLALLFGALQVLGLFVLPFGFLKSKTFTTLGSLNAMGIFAAAILPLFMMKIEGAKSIWKWSKYLGIALILFILIFVNWWVVWTVAIAGMLSFVAFRSFTAGFSPSKFVLPMTVIVIGVFFIVTGLNFSSLKTDIGTEVSPSYGLSFDVAKGALGEKPIFGYGPENFLFAYEKYGASAIAGTSFSNIRFTDSASELYNFVAQTGFVGLASLAFLLFAIVMLLFRSLKGDKPKISPAIGASLVAMLVVFFIYPMTMTLMFSLWFVLALFVIRVEGVDNRVDAIVENSPKYSLISSVAFIMGLIIILSGGYYVAVRNIADMKYASAANDKNLETALQKGVDAININPTDSRYYRATSNILLAQIREQAQAPADNDTDKAERTAKIQNLVQAVFEVTKRSIDKNPHDSANWSQRGSVYQSLIGLVGGSEDLAIENYGEALKRNPSNPSLLNRIGETYLSRADIRQLQAQSNQAKKKELNDGATEDIQTAQDNFKQATEINKNFGIALYNLGRTYERQGKLKEAIGQLEVLAPFNQNDAGLAFELGLLYYRDGRKDASYQQLQRAIKILPNYANALWYLSLINEERGDTDAAIKNLEKIMEGNQGNETVAKRLEQLKKGESTINKGEAINQEPLQIPSAE